MNAALFASENLYSLLAGPGSLWSFLVCLAIVQTKRWHGKLTHDHTHGVQKFHATPTPRVGGIGLFIGFFVAMRFLDPETRALMEIMLLAALPAFFVGLGEDFTKRVSPRERLLATMVSGVIASYLTGGSLTSVDVPLVDAWLAIPLVSIAFTAFAVAGIANAINIIDGFNGLAAGVVIIALVTLGVVAHRTEDLPLAHAAWAIAGVTLGFFLLNFPFGKIFMGDGGAYCLGFMLATLAVLLPERNPEVSPWASLVACAYPVLEVLFSMLRRCKAGVGIGQPDREHLHTLIKARIIKKYLGHWPLVLRNSMVSPFGWLFALGPAWIAIQWAQDTHLLMLAFGGLALAYALTYWAVCHLPEGR